MLHGSRVVTGCIAQKQHDSVPVERSTNRINAGPFFNAITLAHPSVSGGRGHEFPFSPIPGRRPH